MRTMFVAAMAVAIAFSGWIANAQEDQRRVLAEELLNEMNMKQTVEKSFEMVKKMMPAQMARMRGAMDKTDAASNAPKPTDKAIDKVMSQTMDMVAQELNWEKMKEDYITVYAETFTVEELQGAVAFYKSPAGKAFTKKQPELMKRSMELSQKQMAKIMPKIMSMSQELQKEMTPHPKKIAPPEKQKKEGE
jgi:uncharacterized protein